MHRALAFLPLLILLVVPTFVWAGGWAVVTLDAIPTGLEQGDGGPYQVGYTVLQHGLHPAAGLHTSIAIRSAVGETFEFSGRPVGDVGHYVAEVAFPNVGEWTWEVRPGAFPPQALGTVIIIPKHLANDSMWDQWSPVAPQALNARPETEFPLEPLRGGLPFVVVAAWAAFGWSLVAVMRPVTIAGASGRGS